MSEQRDAWGAFDWDGEERKIKVYVDWDLLTPDEARDLAAWLLDAADRLERLLEREKPPNHAG